MSKLTDEEISFLQWLRENGGRRAVSGNSDLSEYGRVVASGYVEVKPNRFSADTIYFTITKGAVRSWNPQGGTRCGDVKSRAAT